ncbi:MAG: hypothetical protein DLM72_05350 [Candidatus Nitrosopolaris wilkensis]|nr:MAG: hypothetical protein DLM72_05350 [Candidatus Nitrosopolaris wilkensis]
MMNTHSSNKDFAQSSKEISSCTLPISSIKIGKRFRNDLGDIASLANDIAERGLLCQIALNHNSELIYELTLENDIVLDPMMGSGTTGIASLNLKRKFVGIEKDFEKFQLAEARIGKFSLSLTNSRTKYTATEGEAA